MPCWDQQQWHSGGSPVRTWARNNTASYTADIMACLLLIPDNLIWYQTPINLCPLNDFFALWLAGTWKIGVLQLVDSGVGRNEGGVARPEGRHWQGRYEGENSGLLLVNEVSVSWGRRNRGRSLAGASVTGESRSQSSSQICQVVYQQHRS